VEAHGSRLASFAQRATGFMPASVGQIATEKAGVDRMSALFDAFASVRRAGTVSIIGVYGGQLDPFPMMDLFDKGVTIRMGQAHVKRWIPDILPLVTGEDDPLDIGIITPIGGRLRQLVNSLDRPGFVVTAGRDRAEAVRRADLVTEIVRFDVEPEPATATLS
jgi:threonine dehydrogenase-like Zn-dependent dehydrogenase